MGLSNRRCVLRAGLGAAKRTNFCPLGVASRACTMVKVTARIGPMALAYQWLGMAGDSTGFKFLLLAVRRK
jgi:hypothetical protein